MMTVKFKAEHTFDQRKAESERVRAKYPDRIPGKIHISMNLNDMIANCMFSFSDFNCSYLRESG
jgi:hypothetical protein